MTYGEKLIEFRRGLDDLAKQLIDSDEYELAMKVLNASTVIRTVLGQFADQGYLNHPWLSAGKSEVSK